MGLIVIAYHRRMAFRAGVLGFVVLMVGCTAVADPPPTTIAPPLATTTTSMPSSAEVPEIAGCPLPDVTVGSPPSTASATAVLQSDFSDIFTSITGTGQSIVANDAGEPAMVIVRGALPPVNWVGATERFDIRGFPAALGPLPDGIWAIAWAESTDRCDLYSIFVYPPGTLEDARRVAESAR